MAQFVDGPVRVTRPGHLGQPRPGLRLPRASPCRCATSSRREVLPEGLVVEVEGAGADGVPRDESHLVVRAMRAPSSLMGAQPPGPAPVVPQRRSRTPAASARRRPRSSPGVVLARGAGRGRPAARLRRGALRPRRRPRGPPRQRRPGVLRRLRDLRARGRALVRRPRRVDPRVTAVVFVPPTGVETTVARGLLPRRVPARRRRRQLRARRAARRRAAPGSPSTCSPRPATGCTRTSASPRCRRRSRSYAACAPTAYPPSCPAAGPTVLAFGTADTSDLLASAARTAGRATTWLIESERRRPLLT